MSAWVQQQLQMGFATVAAVPADKHKEASRQVCEPQQQNNCLEANTAELGPRTALGMSLDCGHPLPAWIEQLERPRDCCRWWRVSFVTLLGCRHAFHPHAARRTVHRRLPVNAYYNAVCG